MKKYGEQHWKPLIVEWLQSGESLASFCKEKGVSSSSFKYWRNKFPELGSEISPLRKVKQESFVEVQQTREIFEDRVKFAQPHSKYLIIKTSYGYTIEVPL